MEGGWLGILLEMLVALLLLATVVYCAIVARKLDRLRSAQAGMRDTIKELGAATRKAEAAIKGLKATVQASEEDLSRRIEAARQLSQDLMEHRQQAEQIMTKIATLQRGKGHEAPGHGMPQLDPEQALAIQALRRAKLGFGGNREDELVTQGGADAHGFERRKRGWGR